RSSRERAGSGRPSWSASEKCERERGCAPRKAEERQPFAAPPEDQHGDDRRERDRGEYPQRDLPLVAQLDRAARLQLDDALAGDPLVALDELARIEAEQQRVMAHVALYQHRRPDRVQARL